MDPLGYGTVRSRVIRVLIGNLPQVLRVSFSILLPLDSARGYIALRHPDNHVNPPEFSPSRLAGSTVHFLHIHSTFDPGISAVEEDEIRYSYKDQGNCPLLRGRSEDRTTSFMASIKHQYLYTDNIHYVLTLKSRLPAFVSVNG